MLTPWLNRDTMNVIGQMSPCQNPNQNPAASGPLIAATLGNGAHAVSTTRASASKTNEAPRAFMQSSMALAGFAGALHARSPGSSWAGANSVFVTGDKVFRTCRDTVH